MKNKELIKLLDRFVNKAWCTYSEQTARSLWKQIAPYIPVPYQHNIQIEWEHVKLGHGIEQARMALKEEVDKFISEKLSN